MVQKIGYFSIAFLLGLASTCAARDLEPAVRAAAAAATAKFPKLAPGQLGITVIDLKQNITASHNGEVPFYPASVVKLFYLVAAHDRMQSGALADTPELQRAIRDMVVDSINDATGVVLDAITGTTGGPELPPAEFAAWQEKRNAVNRYFAALGFTGINVNQKTFAEGPYGRERQSRGPKFENNNRLTTAATARLMSAIVRREAVTKERSNAMLDLLHRDFAAPPKDPDSQATGFSGRAMPKGAEYYAKAGWTSIARHDATYVELPNGARYIAVIFTIDNAANTEIIPFVAKQFVDYFSDPAYSSK